jgi:hypothetical protein
MCAFRAGHYVLAGDMEECNPKNKVGECPIDKIYHRCQITKEENGRQKVTFGRCETQEEDQNNDGIKEKICKCVEDPTYKFKYEGGDSNKGASGIARQTNIEEDTNGEDKEGDQTDDEDTNGEDEEDDERDDEDTKGKGKKKGKEKQSDRD